MATLDQYFDRLAAVDPDTLRVRGERAFTTRRLYHLLKAAQSGRGTSARTMVDRLESRGRLRRYCLKYPQSRTEVFTWDGGVHLEAQMAAHPRAHLSHQTALLSRAGDGESVLRANGLRDWHPPLYLPSGLYLTEKSVRPTSDYPRLTQEIVDATFARPRPLSTRSAEMDGRIVHLLHGRSGADAGIENAFVRVDSQQSVKVRRSCLERTLIEMAVRPEYSGGVNCVLDAYRRHEFYVDVARLRRLLADMHFQYPYHQVIGFYLERAGFRESAVARFRDQPRELDFYLEHGMSKTRYVAKWRLHVPADL